MRHAALAVRAGRAGALALALALAAGACAGDGPDPASAGATAPAMDPAGTERPAPAPRPASIDDTSPQGAVAGFVAAEAAEAHDLSYALLAPDERQVLDSVEAWRDQHAGLWFLAGAEIGEVAIDGDAGTVETRLRFHPALDETLGLTPGEADATWAVTREGDRWRIVFGDLAVEPRWPDGTGAPAQVAEWARARQDCGAAVEYRGGLVGFPALADRLCRADGEVAVGAASPLDGDPDAGRFIAAFGPEVLDWGRVVPVTAPGDGFRAVIAPLGDRWIVVGVLPAVPSS